MRVVVLMMMALLAACSESTGQGGTDSTPVATMYWDRVTTLVDGSPLPSESVTYTVWEITSQVIVCTGPDTNCVWRNGQWGDCYTFAVAATDTRTGLTGDLSTPATWCAPAGVAALPSTPRNFRIM